MPYVGKKPADIIATSVDTDTGAFSGNVTAGGTLGVTGETTLATHLNLGDGDIIKLGASADLTLQHDGSNSYIKDEGTGNLYIRTDGTTMNLQAGSDNAVKITKDAQVELFHDNSVKLATASGGITVTGDIANASGDFTLDVAGDINLDADGAQIRLKDGGTEFGVFSNESSDFIIKPQVQDKDLIFKGNDGGNTITALTLDMSSAGNAFFNSSVFVNDGNAFIAGDGADLQIYHTNGAANHIYGQTAHHLDFSTSDTFRMRLKDDGNLLIGKTNASSSVQGCLFSNNGNHITRSDGSVLFLNRQDSDGTILALGKGDATLGRLGLFGSRLHIASVGNAGIRFRNDLNCITPCNDDGSNSDNDQNLGQSSVRYNTIFATNASINTSDRNEKQDIEELTDAEKRVAIVVKGLMRKYRWKDAVASKGDNARIHFGVIAQDLQDAFTAESLDASKYAMFCSDTWWEKEISVDAVEAQDAVYKEDIDANGEKVKDLVSPAIEAKDAYTYIDDKQEATEGYTERTRLGVRYSELLAFIISAI